MTESTFVSGNLIFRTSACYIAGIRLFLHSGVAALLFVSASGCATPGGVIAARQNFYMGKLDRAELCLTNIPPEVSGNTVMMLMERGTIRQAQGDYEASAKDWQKASKAIEQLDYYSLSKGSASYIANDNVMAFRGAPYERTLLHTLNAQNYLAMSKWDDAAVEARNIVKHLKNLDGFPDDPFSRYVAAFCFEIAGETESAKLEYRRVAELLSNSLTIHGETGRISALPTAGTAALPNDKSSAEQQAELVCFIFSGRIPSESAGFDHGRTWMPDPYSEIYSGGKLLGRSYTVANTGRLLADTERRRAAMRIAKDVTRIVLKEAIAESIEQNNEFLGALVRLILFSMEMPDLRRWETLPLSLQIARVPCPPTLSEYKVVFKDSTGRVLREKTLVKPISSRGNVFVSFCRDI